MLNDKFLELTVKLIDKNDPYKLGHSKKVSKLSELIGLNLKFEDDLISILKTGSLLHDIGKVLLPGDLWCILRELDEEEKAIIKKHPVLGADLLEECNFDEKIIKTVRYHHEWWNGKGYPEGISQNDIPIMARIVGLAEAYISMITYDYYSESIDKERAIELIIEDKGKQFAPQIVDSFLEIMNK
ncbi:MAG: HD-GYP domain-containing protein [Bacillota bacterium]